MDKNERYISLQNNLKSLTQFMSIYWEDDEMHSLKQIFAIHGQPARNMWRSCLICYANRVAQEDGDPQTGALLGKVAAYYMPK